jgi:hypothetical protein
VNIWEGGVARREAERFREIWDIRGPILLDENAEYAERLGIRGVPTNVLVDADGTVVGVGLTRLDELEAAVDRLLGR